MTIQRDLELHLRAHYEERADRAVPDGQVAAILDRTAATRQRPAWLAALRSPSMTVFTLERPVAARSAWLLAALALLVLALLGALVFYGTRLSAPPTNGQIVFSRPNDAGVDVVVVNPDGSHAHQVFSGDADGPFWSPDGRQIAFGHSMIQADGSGLHTWNQSGDPFHIECWDWSPDGNRLLCEGFTDDAASDVQVHGVYTVAASNGKDLIRLSVPGDAGVPGSYSPDGSRVAYLGKIDGVEGALMVVRTDGTDRHRLGTLSNFGGPTWAPDGKSIVAGRNGRLYSIDAETGKFTPIRIKDEPNRDIWAAQWSPDGTRLLIKLFISGDNFDLFTMAADGSDLRRVTNDAFDARVFDWGTRPVEP